MIPESLWNIENTKEEQRIVTLTRFLKQVYTILNRGINPQDNFRGAILNCEFTSADTSIIFKHNLSFTPQYYLVAGISVNMVIYEFVANNVNISLKSSAVGTAQILVF